MLDEFALFVANEKARDLLSRLENKRVEQALPAEMELALLWSLSKLGEMDVEPEWWGDSRRPDAVTEHLIPGQQVAIEIAATSDNAISGEEAMDRIALEMVDLANKVRKGFGHYLYFTFGSIQVFEKGRSVRRRLAPQNYRLSDPAKVKIREWITGGQALTDPLSIREEGLHVVIERKPYKQIRYHNTFSSILPEAHSIDKNPLSDLLTRKLVQLKAATPGMLRFLFVADVGSTLLRRIGTFGEKRPSDSSFSGSDILSHFVQANGARLDGVVAFTPHRRSQIYLREELRWATHTFVSREIVRNQIDSGVKRMLTILPKPHFEGYQARSLFLQDAFSPSAAGWYIGVNMKGTPDQMQISIPARAFLDLLAGRITPQQFEYHLGDRPDRTGLFKGILDRGETLSKVEMAPRDVDEDDDHIVLHFSDDPAARALRLKARPEL